MKKSIKIIIIILIVLCALSVYPTMHFRDISVTSSTAVPYAVMETDSPIVTQGSDLSALEYTVINPCYTDTSIRETIIFSVFDAEGNPAELNGTSAVLSAFDIVTDDTMPIKGKSVQEHQAIYQLSEYPLGAAKHRYPLFPQERSSASTRINSYTLFADRTLSEYSDCIVRVDIVVEYSQDGTTWTNANTITVYLVNDIDTDTAFLAGEAIIPEITPAPSFEWSLENGTAFLVGMGDVTDTVITIPAYVRLDTTGKEDPNGEVYPVCIRKGSFTGNTNLVSVTFSDGITVESGDMTAMFSDCTYLLEVNNIPEGVTLMNRTFSNCTALIKAPTLPSSVLQVASCFSGCVSLTEPPVIPFGCINLSNCFRDCAALESAPLIPESVEKMDGTFVNCISLTQAPHIPESVLSMNYCYAGCTALDGTLYIPCAIINQNVYDQKPASLDFLCRSCTALDSITLNTCSNNPFDTDDLSKTLPIIYLQEHNNEGLCEHCKLVNGTEIVSGFEMRSENAKADLYYPWIDFIVNEVPDYLKEFCTRFYFVNNIEKYSGSCVHGLARNLGNHAYVYIRLDYKGTYSINRYLAYHELSHCYDFQHGISSSSGWLSVYRQEGNTLGSWYGNGGYSIGETFATAAGYYFTGYEELKTECPLAYEFLENLFGSLE